METKELNLKAASTYCAQAWHDFYYLLVLDRECEGDGYESFETARARTHAIACIEMLERLTGYECYYSTKDNEMIITDMKK